MKQSVNLLSAGFTTTLPKLNAYVILTLFIVEAIGLTAYTRYINHQANALENTYLALQTEFDDLSLALESDKAAFVPKTKDPTLGKFIKSLELEKEGKAQVLSLLDTQSTTTQTRPGQMLEAIAEYMVQDLWLTEIHLQPALKNTNLFGKTLQAEYITDYLTALAASKAFLGASFSTLNIRRDKKSNDLLSFELRTTPADNPKTAKTTYRNRQKLQAMLNTGATP